MMFYGIEELARIFELSPGRLQQLHKQGRGPKRTATLTLNGKKGRPRISHADAIAWAESQIERLSSSTFTEADADRYVRGCQRLRVTEFISKARSPVVAPKAAQPQPEQPERRYGTLYPIHSKEADRNTKYDWLPQAPPITHR